MGRFSELSISMYEGPNLTSIDKFICKECVIDSELAKVVSNGLSANYCSYCGVESDEYMAIGFDMIMLHIYNSILCYYADAQDIDVPWLEGGWWVENTEVHEVVNRFDPGWSDDFFSDIVSAIDPLTYWVEHTDGDWTVSNPSTSLLYGWERFKEQVLNKTRYLALSEPEDNFESKRPDHVPVSSMLDALGSVFKRYGNIVNIEAGNEFYRVRAMPKTDKDVLFHDVGVPPAGVASGGRMNPPGISYFYVARDKVTAKKEVIDRDCDFVVSRFINSKDLRLIDFMELPDQISLFLPEQYTKHHEIKFLHLLKEDMIKPVVKDGREHIEYIPTQIISEYFRYRFVLDEGGGVDGFIYPSVKNRTGVNVVIFESSNEDLEKKFDLLEVAWEFGVS